MPFSSFWPKSSVVTVIINWRACNSTAGRVFLPPKDLIFETLLIIIKKKNCYYQFNNQV